MSGKKLQIKNGRCRDMLNRLVGLFSKALPPRYIYGVVKRPDGTERNPSRLDTKTGRVQFVLWQAGEQGHAEDCWHDMGTGWENHFKPNTAIDGL